jgi:Divergent InlB B-repeat domain
MEKRCRFFGTATALVAACVLSFCNKPTSPANYSLTVTENPPAAGAATLSPAGGTYAAGTVVTVTAAPCTGFCFVNWTGDAKDSTASISVTMDAPKTIVANFSVNPGFVYQVRSKPLTGFESTVDAVTKASNVLDTILVRIDSLPPSDSLKELDIYWGDSTAPKVVTGSRFPVGPDFVVLTHWYTRNADTITGYCTTTATATTYGGITRDTTIRIKVLKASEH